MAALLFCILFHDLERSRVWSHTVANVTVDSHIKHSNSNVNMFIRAVISDNQVLFGSVSERKDIIMVSDYLLIINLQHTEKHLQVEQEKK